MFPKTASVLACAAAIALSGCGKKPPAQPQKPDAGAEQADYVAPPAVREVRAEAAGVAIGGQAPPGAQVRLGTPAGQAVFATADAQGRWRIVLPPSDQARIFGLSEKAQGRQVQAEGYVLVGPQGRSALLRAGAGAQRLDPKPSPTLGALDFDHDGAAIVSGLAPPNSLVFLRVDGRQVAEAKADGGGFYAIALPQPQPRTPALASGGHTLQTFGDNFTNTAQVQVSPAEPLADGPLRSQLTAGGLRVDWLTPGGGVQSTVLLD